MLIGTWLLTGVAVLLAAIALAVTLWRAERGWITASALTSGLLAGGIGGFGALVVLVAWGLDPFGLIHLAYLGIVLSLPLLGAGILAARRWRPAGRSVTVVAVVLMLPAPLGIYMTHVEPYWLRVDHHAVPIDVARAGTEPIRIGVLADLQTRDIGATERRAVEEIMAFEPHLVLLPGDLFQGRETDFVDELPELRALLAELEAPGGVWYVRGDSDPADRPERAAEGTALRILDDEVVDVAVGDRRIRLGGTRLDFTGPGATAVIEELVTGAEDDSVRILMTHRPDSVLRLPAGSRVDLVVAGHTHGGQVVLPGLGALVTLSNVSSDVARGGHHTVNGNQIVVGSGVGLERGQAPQMRLLSRPSVSLLTLDDAT